MGKWTSTGMTSGKGFTQTYGKWESGCGRPGPSGIDIAALLWPTNGWPPEVDFAEDDNGARTKLTGTLHYGPSNNVIHSAVAVDMTKWHTYGVIWTPRPPPVHRRRHPLRHGR